VTVAAELVVEISGRDVGVTALLQRVEARLLALSAAAGGASAPFQGSLPTGMGRTANSAISLAQAQARLDAAQGNVAGGVQRLSAALQGQTATTVQNVNAQRQLVGLQNQLAGTSKTLTSQFGALNSAAAQFGIALGAGAIAKAVLDLGRLGAQSASARDSFTNLAISAGTTADVLLSKMHAAAAGTVSDTQLMISSNTGLLLVGEKIAGALPKLLEIARAAAKATGQDVSFLYDSLVKGIARGSPKIIDNAGITLDAASAMDTYAKSIGKTADQLTSSEQQQATLNAVLATGEGFIQKIGLATDSAAVRMQRAQAATDNFKAALGERLAPVIATVADGLTNLLSKGDLFAGASGGAEQAQATITKQATSYEDYVQRVTAANQQLRSELGKTDPVFALIVKGLETLSPSQFAYAQSLIKTGTAQAEAVRQAQALVDVDQILGGAQQTIARGNEQAGASFAALEQEMLQIAAAGPESSAGVLALVESLLVGEVTMPQFTAQLEQLRQATLQHADAAAVDANMLAQAAPVIQQVTQVTDTYTQALIESAAKSQLDAIQSETLAAQKNILAQQAQIAANALIASGNAGAAAAARLAASSSLVDQLTAAYLRLAQAQGAAPGARQTALNRDDLQGARRNAAAPPAQTLALLQDQKRRTDELTAAEGRLAAARGDTAGQIAALRAQQKGLNTTSAEYINIQAQIESIEAKNAKAGKARGAAKISDQARLNNTLLTDQQRADDQLEAAARAHGQRILDIERRFQKASLEQQRANELSKRQSELDFLKSITSSELNSTKEGRAEIARINAQFYADFAASQAAAQAGNVKQSEELAAQAKHRADIELQYAEQIDKARRDKNKSEEARLIALREKERQLLDEQQKQIVEGGDPNVKARQEALDDEQRNFEEQQGKIKTASDDATQRKIDNALREGKNVEALNLQYQQQEEILNRIGTKQPVASAGSETTPTTAPSSTPTSDTTVPGGPADLVAVVKAIDMLIPPLLTIKVAIDKNAQSTASAIRATAGDKAVN